MQKEAATISEMLYQALKLDRVHAFGDISISQLFEKIDYLIELTMKNDLNTIIGQKPATLICIFSLSGARFTFTREKNVKQVQQK